jgi:hypothetical protein
VGGDVPPTQDPPPEAAGTADSGDNPEGNKIITDPELVDLLSKGTQAVGQQALDTLLRTNERFNQHVTPVHHADGSVTYDPNHAHKELLRELPGYTHAAGEASVTPDQATDVLTHAMDAQSWPDLPSLGTGDTLASHLTKIFDASAAKGEAVTPADLDNLKQLISQASENSVIPMTLASQAAGIRAGLSMADSTALVQGHLATANIRIGSNMHHFRDALQALDSAGIDPSTTQQVFQQVQNMHAERRLDVYDAIKEYTIFGTGRDDMSTPDERMGHIAAHLQPDMSGKDLINTLRRDDTLGDHPQPYHPGERRDRHFREVPGPLENRAVPYRTPGSFDEGMRDIRRLTFADDWRGDVVSEGHWVHDGDTDTWYSLGGETTKTTDMEGTTTHHSSPYYDISQLSEVPRSVHIHPDRHLTGADKFGHALPTNADYNAAARIIDEATNPMRLRSFISHAYGVTEFTYPQNPNAMRQVAQVFEDIRTEFFSRFGGENQILQVARRMGDQAFAAACVDHLNSQLPPGFSLRYYPPDSEIR